MRAPPHFPRYRRRGISFGSFAFLAYAFLAAPIVRAAQLEVTPNSGSGRVGEAVYIKGSGFAPSTTIAVFIGESPVIPDGIHVKSDGDVGPVIVLLARPLPAGRHALAVKADREYPVTGAYMVRPLITLDPPIGDGRVGATWRTNKSIAKGGYMGMVFTLQGSGFPAGAFLAADSISVGRAETTHDPIQIGPDGTLPSTTVAVASDLSPGRYDLVLRNGAATVTFSSVFHVAPWAATDTVRQRSAARSLESARQEIKDLVKLGGELLPAEELASLDSDAKGAEAELKAGNFENAEDLSRQIREKLAELGKQVESVRKDKFKALADVISGGLDAIQPPGAPPSREAAPLVGEGRKKLKEAQDAIARADFESAKVLLKAANEALRKARAASGIKGPEEPIRW